MIGPPSCSFDSSGVLPLRAQWSPIPPGWNTVRLPIRLGEAQQHSKYAMPYLSPPHVPFAEVRIPHQYQERCLTGNLDAARDVLSAELYRVQLASLTFN